MPSIHRRSYWIAFRDVKGQNTDLTEEQFIYDTNVHRRHLTDDQKAVLTAEFAPYFKREAEKRKAETQFAGKTPDGMPVRNSGSVVDMISSPPKERDIQAKHANSTAGLVADKADVSEYKATQALAVAQYPESRLRSLAEKSVSQMPSKRLGEKSAQL
jgi:hypothetical protein